MRKYLLPEGGHFYKVNMHSHSTLSDGRQSPEELKEAYKAKGYSAIAFTEHSKVHDLSHLSDDEFIAITSYEMDFSQGDRAAFSLYEGAPRSHQHTEAVHLNLYARNPHQNKEVAIQDIWDCITPETINEGIRRAREAGFLVVYNHPSWSLNTYPLYSQLRGLCGIEIENGASQRSSDRDYTPHVYDEMARCGIRMSPIAGDDNHRACHFFHAWTMVKADSLTYDNLINGIEKGDCYASSGPEIFELYMEDGEVTVRCSEAAGIFYSTAGRAKAYVLDENEVKTPVTEASFKVDPADIYFRITIRDYRGNHACSRIYYLDEL